MLIHKTDKPDPHDEPPAKPAAPAGKVGAAPRTDPDAPPAPVITALVPPSVAIGDPSFTLRVVGAGFDPTATIVIAGRDEATTFLSEEELVTVWNMPLWHGPDSIPVLVRLGTIESNTVNFVLQPPRPVPLDPAEASKPTPSMNLI